MDALRALADQIESEAHLDAILEADTEATPEAKAEVRTFLLALMAQRPAKVEIASNTADIRRALTESSPHRTLMIPTPGGALVLES